ncbi:hypothetical protein [Sphaerisporangium perillae]|uniref:hypothetical protein n=1 Tax=Sphaerisporangium perillae TaxID=2935860 RepID=UPI00200E6B4E|nr:hypothetical protein [Sphaerisporangium perillae]
MAAQGDLERRPGLYERDRRRVAGRLRFLVVRRVARRFLFAVERQAQRVQFAVERQAAQRGGASAAVAARRTGEQRQVPAGRVEGPAPPRGVHGARVEAGARVRAEPPHVQADAGDVVPPAPAVGVPDVHGAGDRVEGDAQKVQPPGVPQIRGAQVAGPYVAEVLGGDEQPEVLHDVGGPPGDVPGQPLQPGSVPLRRRWRRVLATNAQREAPPSGIGDTASTPSRSPR